MRTGNKTPHFRVNRQLDPVGAKHFLIHTADTVTCSNDIDRSLIRLVRNTDPAGHINKGKCDSECFPDLKNQSKKLTSQSRVIFLLQ